MGHKPNVAEMKGCSNENSSVELEEEPDAEHSTTSKKCWLNQFLSDTRRDRVKWNSKCRKFSEQTLYEETKDMLDVAAAEFVDWMNGLSSDDQNRLDKETIKDFFALGIERSITKAVNVKVTSQPAIPPIVAELFHSPEKSIANKVKQILTEDTRASKKPKKYVAFGRTLPMALRNIPSDIDSPCELDFPDEIRSGKLLFYGIEHLRSTKMLAEHLNANPSIPKPKYLQAVETKKHK